MGHYLQSLRSSAPRKVTEAFFFRFTPNAYDLAEGMNNGVTP